MAILHVIPMARFYLYKHTSHGRGILSAVRKALKTLEQHMPHSIIYVYSSIASFL